MASGTLVQPAIQKDTWYVRPLNTLVHSLVQPAIQKYIWRVQPLNTLVESYTLKGYLVCPQNTLVHWYSQQSKRILGVCGL